MHRAVVFILMLLSITANLFAQKSAPPTSGSSLLSDDVNAEFPKWLRLGAEYRARVEGFTGGGFKPNSEDAYLLSRVRINMFLLPTSWLKFGFQGQDAHVFWKNQNPAVPPYQDSMDMRQAYVEFGDIEKNRIGQPGQTAQGPATPTGPIPPAVSMRCVAPCVTAVFVLTYLQLEW